MDPKPRNRSKFWWPGRLWTNLIGPGPDAELLRLSNRPHVRLGRLTLAYLGAIGVLAILAPLSDGSPILGELLALVATAVVAELAWQAVEKRWGRVLWLLIAKVALFAALIGVGLWVCISVAHPVAYTRHPIVFLVFLLLITTTGLRDEPRLPLAAGAASLLCYWVVAALVPELAATSAPVKSEVLSRGFDDTSVIGHSVMIACTTVMAVASARRAKAIGSLSVRDGLTGLLNRRAFDLCLASEAESARRSLQPLCIAMLDVDHFKSLNDEHGHSFGDDVLRWIARTLREGVRSSDLVARYGGEEFVVVFRGSAEDPVIERLDALRARIARAELHPSESERTHVSISIGIGTWPHDGDEAEEVLAAADRRLYAAKNAGRNRLVAPSIGEEPRKIRSAGGARRAVQ